MSLRTILMAALVAGATSACGGSGGGYSTGTNMNAGGGGGGTPGSVTVQDFAFSPSTTTIKAGSAVTWSNVGAATHHPVADAGAFDIGDLAPAQSGAYGMSSGVGGMGSFTFSSPGMYSYHCSIHPQMTGTITVMP
jgi:plastocyanin